MLGLGHEYYCSFAVCSKAVAHICLYHPLNYQCISVLAMFCGLLVVHLVSSKALVQLPLTATYLFLLTAQGPNNVFGLTEYDGCTSFFGGKPALSQGKHS